MLLSEPLRADTDIVLISHHFMTFAKVDVVVVIVFVRLMIILSLRNNLRDVLGVIDSHIGVVDLRDRQTRQVIQDVVVHEMVIYHHRLIFPYTFELSLLGIHDT